MTISLRGRYRVFSALRWTARISSVLISAGLIVFLFSEGFSFSTMDTQQWTGFLFLPAGLVFGFIIGWRSNILGGLISLVSLLGFYLIYGLILTGHLPNKFALIFFSIPAILFLISGTFGYFFIGKLAEKPFTRAPK